MRCATSVLAYALRAYREGPGDMRGPSLLSCAHFERSVTAFLKLKNALRKAAKEVLKVLKEAIMNSPYEISLACFAAASSASDEATSGGLPLRE